MNVPVSPNEHAFHQFVAILRFGNDTDRPYCFAGGRHYARPGGRSTSASACRPVQCVSVAHSPMAAGKSRLSCFPAIGLASMRLIR